MTRDEIKKILTEPIVSKKVDPFLFIPLVVLAPWIGTTIYRRTGISYAEYILWLVPISIIGIALYILLIKALKKHRAKQDV